MDAALLQQAQQQAQELIKTLKLMTKDKGYEDFPICLDYHIANMGDLLKDLKDNV